MTEYDSLPVFEPGALVLHTGHHLPARMVAYEGLYGSYLRIRWIHSGFLSSYATSAFVLLSNEPPVQKGTPIDIRRMSLLRNIQNIVGNVSGSRRRLMQRVEMLLGSQGPREHMWHRLTIAEAVADARQISWSTRIEDVDHDLRRRRGRPATWLRWSVKQGYESFTSEEIRVIAELMGNTIIRPESYTFEVVHGEDVYDAYNCDSCPESCMRYSEYVRFYGNNPKNIALVKILQDGEYMGRALLWTADSGHVLLDRIYPDDGGLHIQALRAYADEQGWRDVWRGDRSYLNETGERLPYRVTVVNPEMEWPYCDSFRYLIQTGRGTKTFLLQTSSYLKDGQRFFLLESTRGHVIDYDGDEICGDLVTYADRYDDDCDEDDDGY